MKKILSILLIILILIIGVFSFLNIKDLISGIIFIIYLIISILLIVYSWKDINKQKYFEKEIQKRTENLEKEKVLLKEKILKFNQEEKQLENELGQMQEWYDMTVKRELQMIELKNQLKSENK